MIKYSLLICHKDYGRLINELGNIGVFHVLEKYEGQDIGVKKLKRLIKEIEEQVVFLKEFRGNNQLTSTHKNTYIAEELIEVIKELRKQLEESHVKNSILNKEIEKLQPWAELTRDYLSQLAVNDKEPHCFISHPTHFNLNWVKKYHIEIINQNEDAIYFLIITKPGASIEIDAEETVEPLRFTLNELINQQKDLKEKVTDIEVKLNSIAHTEIPTLTREQQMLIAQLNVKIVELNTKNTCEEKLQLLEGFVPKNKEDQLQQCMKAFNVHYVQHNANAKDLPPVLLENNRFSRLFEPITKLFSLPAYMNIDLTPFFAPFFLLFFGFCLGDAVYGLIILIIASLLKYTKKYKKNKSILSLVQLFGLATIVVGTITGTFLGISHDGLKLGEYHSLFLDQQQLFNLALIIGIVQILFALILQAIFRIRKMGILYGLQQVGWICIIIGIIDLSFSKIYPKISEYVIYSGITVIVLFANPKVGVLKGLGKGIWDLYGITGLFGDVLSYIRLFALGISSSILGLVVNSIALDILETPYVGWFFFILFMIIGHGLNLVIASLGAFVHPLRLTFVEFYKNAGFEAGGIKYKPFSINNLKT